MNLHAQTHYGLSDRRLEPIALGAHLGHVPELGSVGAWRRDGESQWFV